MVTRGDIIMLGLSAGVSGALIGGMLLGIGLNLVVAGANIGWLLLLPAAPCAAVVGWFMAVRLARQLDDGPPARR